MENEDLENFINYSDFLVENQAGDGSYPFSSDFPYRMTELKKGWSSALTQGQVLSLMARAYYVTGDYKYIDAGKKCLDFMLKDNDSENTGTRQTIDDLADLNPYLKKYENYYVFEEYPTHPKSHVLNGGLFAIQGLYDWSQICPDKSSADLAKENFDQAVKAYEIMLPFYDFYGLSSYDLMQYTEGVEVNLSSGYAHACHIVSLKVLYDVTGNETFYKYYKRFKSYTDDPFFKQTEDLYKRDN